MSGDRCKNRLWKKQLEHCDVFCLIKMEENQRFPTYTLQKLVRNESHGREGKQDPNISISFEITVQTGSHCWGWSSAQVVPSSEPEQRFIFGSQYQLQGLQGRELAPNTSHTSLPALWAWSPPLAQSCGQNSHKTPWKERGERDHKQKKQMKFSFYICFLLRELLLWVKSAETSLMIAAWIFKPGYKYLGFLNSDYCLCFLPI